MSGNTDSIRRAREVPGKEGVVKEILNAVKAAIPELLKQPKCSSEGVRGRNA
jgi:hypothetical protein